MGQSDAVYEVVSLQREAERNNEGRGQLVSTNEEEEVDEGLILFYHFVFKCEPYQKVTASKLHVEFYLCHFYVLTENRSSVLCSGHDDYRFCQKVTNGGLINMKLIFAFIIKTKNKRRDKKASISFKLAIFICLYLVLKQKKHLIISFSCFILK